MDLWIIQQSKSVESNIDTWDQTSSTVDGSLAGRKRKRMRKYHTDFLTFSFSDQFVKTEKHPHCVRGEVLANRSLCRHLTKNCT
jgi:hypothetical protein